MCVCVSVLGRCGGGGVEDSTSLIRETTLARYHIGKQARAILGYSNWTCWNETQNFVSSVKYCMGTSLWILEKLRALNLIPGNSKNQGDIDPKEGWEEAERSKDGDMNTIGKATVVVVLSKAPPWQNMPILFKMLLWFNATTREYGQDNKWACVVRAMKYLYLSLCWIRYVTTVRYQVEQEKRYSISTSS